MDSEQNVTAISSHRGEMKRARLLVLRSWLEPSVYKLPNSQMPLLNIAQTHLLALTSPSSYMDPAFFLLPISS
jgi:hypothetical protein